MQLINPLFLGLAQSVQAIVGGTDATSSTAPFIVSINANSFSGKSHICGGILRDANTIITAAACCDGYSSAALTALYGGIDRTNLLKQSAISSVEMHPNWNPDTLDYNVCLLKLSSAASEGNGVAFASLATQPLTADDEVTVVGWGRIAPLSPTLPKILQQMNAKFSSKPECEVAWKDYTPPVAITSNTMCDIGEDGASVCAADAGGPVILATGEVAGLTSNATERCTSSPEPNLDVDFTDARISAFIKV